MATLPDSFDPAQYDAEVTREENVVEVVVPASETDEPRIDKYLTRFYPEASRTKIQRAIKKGHLKVNGADVKKSYPVAPGDEIVFRLIRKPPMQAEPEAIPLDVVYEDDDLLVVNKPAGMVVHPAPGHRSGTLVHALLHHVDGGEVAADDERDEVSEEEVGLSMVNALPQAPDHPVVRPGIVHRLDKGTSGLLVVAKRGRAHHPLASQFKAHTVDRRYRAIVWGRLAPPSGTIAGAIGRDPHHRQRMAVVPEDEGKWARTHYETVEAHAHTSVVEFGLDTGRTHQIRVHARAQGHPLLGDPKYGGQRVRYGTQGGARRSFFEELFELLPHPALHAFRLGFDHPITEDHLHFGADPPTAWRRVLDRLRRREGEQNAGA
ncbi:RluA family pseudouridine synthase [Salinibacter altiplanensis]|uniref:RluA family pseudouridine synthase n=1 Tax=Salinibacter altiplanensis TaxID=1803181 RepID=UPI000C9F9A82|nr:RluA family pseudouridine synthase [Salinibacter altiplanensis]